MAQEQDDGESAAASIARRQREAAGRAAARAKAHQDYGRQLRSGQTPDLKQPADLVAYGTSPSLGPSGAPSDSGNSAPRRNNSQAAADALLQLDAAIRSGANTATFGGADKFSAAMDALFAPGGLSGIAQRYRGNLQQEQARDRYDGAHRQMAASLGSIAGASGILAFGPEEAAAAAMPRLAGAAKLTAKEVTGIAGAGGLAGLGWQTVSDLATGHRSTAGDVVGSVAGGMTGAVALPFVGPSRAGAVDGAVTSATQDVLNGRPISIPQTVQSALTGGLLAGATGGAGRKWSDGLSSTEKGRLGETMGPLRSEFSGEPRYRGARVRAPLHPDQTAPLQGKQKYWIPDGLGGQPPKDNEPWPDMFEDKFGYGADTSTNQKIAQKNFEQKFRLNHFTPSDVGMMTAFPFLTIAPQFVRRDQGR